MSVDLDRLTPAQIVGGLNAFAGIGRRFDAIGDEGRLQFGSRQVLGFEDYGHHPTELDAVIQAARGGWPERRLVLVFQPHRFSRTRDQFDAFSRVLAETDVLILDDIYTAGEAEIAGIDSDTLAASVRRRSSIRVERIAGWAEAETVLDAVLEDQDLLLIMGAGDVGRLAAQLSQRYSPGARGPKP